MYSNVAKFNNIKRSDFENLSRAALQNSFFNFKVRSYKQIDGVVMESPLGPTLANALLYFLNRFGLMTVLMNSDLYTSEDMSMTYFFCFVHLIILETKILKIETLDSPVRKNITVQCLFLSEPAMVSNHLCITNQQLVEYIQISTVSFPKIIKLV